MSLMTLTECTARDCTATAIRGERCAAHSYVCTFCHGFFAELPFYGACGPCGARHADVMDEVHPQTMSESWRTV